MSLNKKTIVELKLSHENEIKKLNELNLRELSNIKNSMESSGQLSILLNKMENSTKNLDELSYNIRNNNKKYDNERQINLEKKEQLLIEKDKELINEKKMHNELIKKFNILIEQTNNEKNEIKNDKKNLLEKENLLIIEKSKIYNEFNKEKELFNEIKRKFELKIIRWEKDKEIELQIIDRKKIYYENLIKELNDEKKFDIERIKKTMEFI